MRRWSEFFEAVADDLEQAGYWERPHGPELAYDIWKKALDRQATEAQARRAAASE